MKIGVFGGTFDPIHWGHLILSEVVRDQEGLDEVVFVPTAAPPHKSNRQILDIRHRLEMVRRAIAGLKGFRLSLVEAEAGRVSYTIDTMDRLASEYPAGTQLRFILGADQLAEIKTWKDYPRLLKQYGVYVADRVGSRFLEQQEISPGQMTLVEMPLIEVSATMIRRRVADGKSIRFFVPADVEAYIFEQGLYRRVVS